MWSRRDLRVYFVASWVWVWHALKIGFPPSGMASQTGILADLGWVKIVFWKVDYFLMECGFGCICVVFVRVVEGLFVVC